MSDQSGSGGAWHPDPLNRYSQRWWDGSAWTDQVIDATGETIADPMGISAAPAVDATIVDPIAEPGSTTSFGAPPPPGVGTPPPPGMAGSPGMAPMGGGQSFTPGVSPAPASSTNGLAIAAIILGIGALFFCWIPFFGLVSVPFALGGVICGFLGLSAAKKIGTGKGLAMAGIIGGGIALVAAVFITIAVVVWADNVTDDFDDFNSDPPDGICDSDRFWQDPDC